MSRGYAIIGLDNPKSTVNVGATLRAAGCYGAAGVYVGGSRNRYRPAPTDVQKVYRHIPLVTVDDLHDVIPYDCIPVAIDLVDGATSLVDYKHPARAFYVFGAEDTTLGSRVLSWCRDKVFVPTASCMNLAACVNVVLYDRTAKAILSGAQIGKRRPTMMRVMGGTAEVTS